MRLLAFPENLMPSISAAYSIASYSGGVYLIISGFLDHKKEFTGTDMKSVPKVI